MIEGFVAIVCTVIGCAIGIAGFYVGIVSRAKQDGRMLEKIDQCCKGIDEIKKDMKEKNHNFDDVIDEHSQRITRLEAQVTSIFKRLNNQ